MNDLCTYPLYDPAFEHGSCGVGFIADTKGRARADIIPRALEALNNLAHRGAVGADALTGDGAGITINVCQDFFKEEYTRLAFSQGIRDHVQRLEKIAVGMFFLPRTNARETAHVRAIVEQAFDRRGFSRCVWRKVPTLPEVLGYKAAATMPHIEQLLIPLSASDLQSEQVELEFDRRLYGARREIEARVLQKPLSRTQAFYVCSLSCRTLVYKGLMMVHALGGFYPDLQNPAITSSFAVFHQRYSTNTFPAWELAQPFRMLSHNGEINTIVGNRNSTLVREADLHSPIWNADLDYITPILREGQSDSAHLDSVAELLALSGRSLPHGLTMLVPEAWEALPECDPRVRAFYRYHACLNEPWDGPAALVFCDGEVVGATLDRNGLRPARYKVTRDDLLILSSEVGIIDVDPVSVVERGRLGPGHMIAVDLNAGGIIRGDEIKRELSSQAPYEQWIDNQLIQLPFQAFTKDDPLLDHREDLTARQACFGYSREEIAFMFEPMSLHGHEPVSSMGDDTPLAILSRLPRLLPTYFKQRFAQVTNPPIDPIREKLVMSLSVNLGMRCNWFTETPAHARQVELLGPCIIGQELEMIVEAFGHSRTASLHCVFELDGGPGAMRPALEALCLEAESAIDRGCELIILSDRMADADHVPIPILLAVGAVNQHLLTRKKRLRASIIVDSGEPRDVHHFATLIGYGASAVHPYLALQTIASEVCDNDLSLEDRAENFRQSIHDGLLKVMSKMGISVMGSYRGSQIFEAIGLADEVITRCFPNTPSRVAGIGFEGIAIEALARHRIAYGVDELKSLDDLGYFRFRRNGEVHAWSPKMLGAMGGFRKAKADPYKAFVAAVDDCPPVHLRDLLDFVPAAESIALEEVEPIEAIRTRFTTAAMSLGSLSPEAHDAIAIAMNRIGGKSNTGEGGEDRVRYQPQHDGDSANAAIKQVASGRFGVTPEYLMQAKEIEIKMAQGSKPGEGGQLPGHKVTPYIASLRYAIPGVPLISPPPHHDIYSIEDLAQLIYDLKQINAHADICVKLVSEAGVGTIAAGVAKAYADVILISGHDGGTGASPLSSIKNAGSAWELGLAETQQVLMLNGLRERVKLRADGGLKTGRDIVIAALLGAEEYNFGTAALIAIGCRYVRQCHLDTCPVGIATQRPDLRTKFDGNPDALVAYFNSVARDVRHYLAKLGARSLQEIIGRVELLEQVKLEDHDKANSVDLTRLITVPSSPTSAPYRTWPRNARPSLSLNDQILEDARGAVVSKTRIHLSYPIRNIDRTVGARLSGHIAMHYGNDGLAPETITLEFHGTAGQSFGAFNIAGVTLILRGESNDYVGKGMSGGEIIISPLSEVAPDAHDVLIGNTVLYGATGGSLWVKGAAGERFAVRNSGATAVVEGLGDHGCEYMTAGMVVVLGKTGKNFGAGMTGGLAFVYDPEGVFPVRCHNDFVMLERVAHIQDKDQLHTLLEEHARKTASQRVRDILSNWENEAEHFWRVVPTASLRLKSKKDTSSTDTSMTLDEDGLEAGGE